MTLGEIGVALIGLCAGYWVLTKLFRPPPRAEPSNRRRRAGAGDGGSPWHQVLGVSPSATRDEIRRAYRTLLSRYHPDKSATLSQEMRELAERKSREITHAYRHAMQRRSGAR